ncbi:hypothetical protein [Planosporangium mesophilum]|uniref:Uncharacterized protein n=1 Tax=Planosporangium mesophilum TaxID=689768 RepID=A0A8J3TDF9_9ACTN|nr:hypothetical protein [Planosporangium mesophilum]NJC85137.1 hypothetical protein [Planosporangium mesophilum]GII24279.1 hypothetical protein Pme01_38760 [Planosporangium mesophilum]
MPFNISHRSPEEIEDLNRLADEVVSALSRAGLPAAMEVDAIDDHMGALVYVDTVADAIGGVHVRWRPHPELAAASRRAFEAGDYTHADMDFDGAVAEAMAASIMRILQRAGFQVQDAAELNDYQPFEVRVHR